MVYDANVHNICMRRCCLFCFSSHQHSAKKHRRISWCDGHGLYTDSTSLKRLLKISWASSLGKRSLLSPSKENNLAKDDLRRTVYSEYYCIWRTIIILHHVELLHVIVSSDGCVCVVVIKNLLCCQRSSSFIIACSPFFGTILPTDRVDRISNFLFKNMCI